MASEPRGRRKPEAARLVWLGAALAATSGLVIGLGGCAERRSPADIELQAHTAAWGDPVSPDFHGLRVAAEGKATCVGCHSVYGGDAKAGVPACNDCHVGASGHPGGFRDPGSATFHGGQVAAAGTGPCRTCHGADYAGGWSDVACGSCHPGGANNDPPPWSGHPDGWMTRESSLFHGLKVLTEGVDDCTRCHGFGLGGGTSGVACAQCHT